MATRVGIILVMTITANAAAALDCGAASPPALMVVVALIVVADHAADISTAGTSVPSSTSSATDIPSVVKARATTVAFDIIIITTATVITAFTIRKLVIVVAPFHFLVTVISTPGVFVSGPSNDAVTLVNSINVHKHLQPGVRDVVSTDRADANPKRDGRRRVRSGGGNR